MSHYIVINGWTVGISGQTVDKPRWTVGKPKTFKPQVTNQVNTCECTQLLWIMCKLKTSNPGLLIFKPVTNFLLYGQIVNYRPVHL